jgi:hypothetical protein
VRYVACHAVLDQDLSGVTRAGAFAVETFDDRRNRPRILQATSTANCVVRNSLQEANRAYSKVQIEDRFYRPATGPPGYLGESAILH